MNPSYDVVIAGAGLAGACAALYLSKTEEVLVLDAALPASGASGAAAGLVNPFMGRKAKSVWRKPEALSAFTETLHLANAKALFRNTGILRPARSEEQKHMFTSAAHLHAPALSWLTAETVQYHYPMVMAPFGALWVPEGGAVAVPAYVDALLAQAVRQGAHTSVNTSLQSWHETTNNVELSIMAPTGRHTLRTKRLILALGYGYTDHHNLSALNLHGVKGQVVHVPRPPLLAHCSLPILSGRGYIVPEPDTLILGSSHEHTFTDLLPSPEQSNYILQNVRSMLPALANEQPIAAQAGVRVTVPRTRLPMLGPLPNHTRSWIFTGLGTKGLLMAPLLAQQLPKYITHPNTLPDVIRPH